jgi:thioester reductase-like protein
VRYELWNPALSPRTLPVCGDLSLPWFGLSVEKFQELSAQIDVIYHGGAWVDFTKSYTNLKPANVGGTEEVLRLACTERTKPVHYVSTLSVFGDEADPGPTGFAEDDVPDPDSGLRGGYAQSKWVAEQIARIAGARGLPITVYRTTAITGDSHTGVWNTSDFLCRVIKTCIELGKAPDSDDVIDMAPVDYVSKAIVYLSNQERFWGQTFHLNNPSPLSVKELIKCANTWGYCVELVPFAQWLNDVHDVAKRFPDHILYPLLPLFDEGIRDSESRAEPGRHRYDCRKTLGVLAGSGVTCPDKGAGLLQTYFSYFVRSRFIPAPQPVARPSP